jgi:hypothetical protein
VIEGFPVVVDVSAVETYIAAQVGSMRHVASLQQGSFKGTFSRQDWDGDCNGTIGEMALAKALGTYWSPSINVGKAADVAGYQVRTTTHRDGCLIIRGPDEKNEPYVLCIFEFPRVVIPGWIWLAEAKVDAFRRPADSNGPEAFWVPQKNLRSEPLPQN